MTNALNRKTLVLNADFQPLATYPLSTRTGREAVETLLRGRAYSVEDWDDAVLRSANFEIAVPKVLVLKEYAPISSRPKFCRRSVFLRDRFCCQYCGQRFPEAELTFDHVIPRANGGQTVWDNILTACEKCNTAKKSRAAKWSGRKGSGLRPLKEPRQPSTAELLKNGLELLDPVIKETFQSWLYWNADLKA